MFGNGAAGMESTQMVLLCGVALVVGFVMVRAALSSVTQFIQGCLTLPAMALVGGLSYLIIGVLFGDTMGIVAGLLGVAMVAAFMLQFFSWFRRVRP